MDWQVLGSILSNNGFAVFVGVYMLVFMRKTIEANTQALRDVQHIIEKCEFRKG